MSANEIMRIVEVLLLPPGLIIWVGLLVMSLVTIRPRIFSRLFVLALAVTWLLSTPVVSQWLIDRFQDDFPPLETLPPEADVIVVLGGGHFPGGKEYGSNGQPGAVMLQRLVYASWLSRNHGNLPVIVTEGRTRNEKRNGSHAGAQFLKKVLGVEQVIVEGRATSTFENAKFTAPLLKNYRKPVLVTNYYHMARAMESFMYFGVKPVPAPTGWVAQPVLDAAYWDWLPHPRALEQSYTALHELLGYYWYRWNVFSNGAPAPQHR